MSDHVIYHLLQRISSRMQTTCNRIQIGMICFAKISCGGTHLRNDALGNGTTIAHGFATDQVVRLNRGSAFINRQNARIAVVLRGAGFFNEAHTAVYLYTGRGHVNRHLCRPAFDDRHHELIKREIRFSTGLIRMKVCSIESCCRDISQRPSSLGLRTHTHQHATHIRVMNNRDRAR